MRAAFLLIDYGRGGVERMVINTASALARTGMDTHLIVSDPRGPYLDEVDPSVSVEDAGPRPSASSLAGQLRAIRADVVISAKLADDRLLAKAARRIAPRPRLLFRVGNPIGHRLRSRGGWAPWQWWQLRSLRRLYRQADGCIAVSSGIAEDLTQSLRVPRERIHVLPNPTVSDQLFTRANDAVSHPWFQSGSVPVVVAAGGLRKQKDYATLLRAFARARTEVDARLVILGDGRQRERLLTLGAELGIADALDLPGWVSNPHAYMARASVFALSSRWEGSPNALVEAAALGIPVVATDCISGPRDILQNGRLGGLVPVGDDKALASALVRALTDPPSASWTRSAAAPYHAQASAEAYGTTLRTYAPDPESATARSST